MINGTFFIILFVVLLAINFKSAFVVIGIFLLEIIILIEILVIIKNKKKKKIMIVEMLNISFITVFF